MVRDGDHVEVPARRDVVEDRDHVGGAVRRDGVDVQVGASRSVAHGASGFAAMASAASGAVAGRYRSGRRRRGRRLEVRPDREEHGPPLLGGVLDDAFEAAGDGGHRRDHALAAAALRGHLDGIDAPDVATHADPPRPDHVDRRTTLDREHRRAERQLGRRTEQLGRHAAAGQVAIADDADARAIAQRGLQLPPRLAQPDEAQADGTARADEPRLEPGVIERFHRRDGGAGAGREQHPRQLDATEMEPDVDRRLARAERRDRRASGVSTSIRSSMSAGRMPGARATSR